MANACTCNNKEKKEQDRPADTATAMENNNDLLDTTGFGKQSSPEDFDTATQRWVLKTLNKKQFNTADFQAHSNAAAAEKSPRDTAQDIESLPSGPLGPSTHFEMPENYKEHYASILRWSKDSNYVVDLGSYGMVAVEGPDGKVKLDGGEPDTRVMLVNPIKNEQTQILFGGPGLHVMDAKWVNDSVFALLYANTVHQKPDTLLMFTNTRTMQTNTYNHHEKN